MKRLPKMVAKKQKRIGHGIGSGKGGHTVGKGQKGQKSRAKLSIIFEGLKVKKSFIKKLPFKRGKGKFSPLSKPAIVKLGELEVFPQGSEVTIENLTKNGIISSRETEVKILSGGKLTKALKVTLPTSIKATKEIEKLGGKVEVGGKKVEDKIALSEQVSK